MTKNDLQNLVKDLTATLNSERIKVGDAERDKRIAVQQSANDRSTADYYRKSLNENSASYAKIQTERDAKHAQQLIDLIRKTAETVASYAKIQTERDAKHAQQLIDLTRKAAETVADMNEGMHTAMREAALIAREKIAQAERNSMDHAFKCVLDKLTAK